MAGPRGAYRRGVGQTETAIRTEALSRRFETVTAVEGLDLELTVGTVFGFLGPNGAGKTTTIRLLLGLLEPTAGRASVLGHDVATEGAAVRRSCGVVLEHTGLYERLSAEENLEYYGRLWRIPEPERRSRALELLEHFGLADRRTEVLETWSRGMKQKVALARALLHRPRMVFLDEPTAGLDPIAAAAFRADIVELAGREGVTVFITTHNLVEAERVCDRLGVIDHGRLVAEGTPASLRARVGGATVRVRGNRLDQALPALRARPEVASVDTGDGGLEIRLKVDGTVSSLVRLLVEAGAEVEEVQKGTASLEEAFISLLGEGESSRGS